jgi:hypothetical protein
MRLRVELYLTVPVWLYGVDRDKFTFLLLRMLFIEPWIGDYK